jgi:hypothetical protein
MMLAGCEVTEVDDPDTFTVDCALDGATTFGSKCRADTVEREGRWTVTFRAPAGDFRRFVFSDDRIETADGAAPARVTVRPDGMREVAVEDDRFLVPAP